MSPKDETSKSFRRDKKVSFKKSEMRSATAKVRPAISHAADSSGAVC